MYSDGGGGGYSGGGSKGHGGGGGSAYGAGVAKSGGGDNGGRGWGKGSDDEGSCDGGWGGDGDVRCDRGRGGQQGWLQVVSCHPGDTPRVLTACITQPGILPTYADRKVMSPVFTKQIPCTLFQMRSVRSFYE